MSGPPIRRIDLDFQPHGAGRRGGLLLLALGLLACASLAWRYDQLARETADLHAAAARLQAGVRPRAVSTNPAPSASETAAARSAVEALNLPWASAFAAIETFVHPDIALLAVQTDPRKRELRIAAEARNLPAMLAYHQRLQREARLRDVALADHQVAAGDPSRPVKFNLVAHWTEPP